MPRTPTARRYVQAEKPKRIEPTRTKDDKFTLLSLSVATRTNLFSRNSGNTKSRTQAGGGAARPTKKTGESGAVTYQARKNALYASARRSAKELKQSGVDMLEDMQAKLKELRSQQTTFEKYREDLKTPRLVLQQSVEVQEQVYAPLLEELGERRSETLEGASTMLKHNAPRRQNALKEFSMNVRQQLEQAKQQEKDAEDATALIKRVKNLMHG